MKIRASVLALLVAGTVAMPTAYAQKQYDNPETGRFGNPTSIGRQLQDYLYGVVKTIDANEVVLDKTKFGVDQTIKFEKATKFVRDGKPSTLDALKVGDSIYVKVKTEKKTGEMTAKKVLSGVVATGT